MKRRRPIRRRKRLSFDALLRFTRRADREVQACEKSGAYLAGCALLGAALEMSLAAMLRMYPHRAHTRGKKLSAHWDLIDLIRFAREVGWLDYKGFLAAERIRKNRNLLHPNWYASRKPTKITRHMLAARQTDFRLVLDTLLRTVYASLRIKMRREGLLGPNE